MKAQEKLVEFLISEFRMALSIESVDKILPNLDIFAVSSKHRWLVGTLVSGSASYPVVDGRMRFGVTESFDSKNMIVVVAAEGRYAMRVDEVLGIVTYDDLSFVREADLNILAPVGSAFSATGRPAKLDPDHVLPPGFFSEHCVHASVPEGVAA